MTSQRVDPDAFVELGDTRRRIVDAAVAAFAARGFHATTTRDIALAAGLSPAGMYVHYPSKAAVLAQVSLLGHRAARRLVETALTVPGPSAASGAAAPAATSVERLRTCVETFTAWHARHHQVARVVQYELEALTGEDRAEVTRIRRDIESAVETE